MKKFLLNITLIIVSSSFSLLLLEGISRVFFKAAYTHVVNTNGDIATMQIDPGNPGKGLKPFFEGRMVSGEFDVSISLDSLGLRRTVEIGEKTGGTPFQIILLGDSFMFGWGVEFPQSYATILAKELSDHLDEKVVIYPFAIPGTGQISQISFLEQKIYCKPDIIIVSVYMSDHVTSGNDLIENLNEYYKLNSQNLSDRTDEISKIDFLRQIRRWLKNNSNLFRFVETRLSAIVLSKFSKAINIESDPEVMDKAWSLTDSILVDIQKRAELYNALCIIQYIPNMLDLVQKNNNTYYRLERLCVQHKIPLAPNPIDLLLYHTKNSLNISDFYFVVDGHWTPKSHEIAAIATANFLAEIIDNTF